MGMGGGSTGGAMSDMNVTPLIDVLLVLLIIFMVIVPVTPRGLETLVPQPPKEHKEEQQNDRTIVVQVRSNGAAAPSYLINEQRSQRKTSNPSWRRFLQPARRRSCSSRAIRISTSAMSPR